MGWGSFFIFIVVFAVFGVGLYGYNNMIELSTANWLVVSSGLATLFGTFLSGVTAMYGFVNKREIEELKEKLAVSDLKKEIELARDLRILLAHEYKYIMEKGSLDKQKKHSEELKQVLSKFSKIKCVSKLKKYKTLNTLAKQGNILIDLDKDYIKICWKFKIKIKSNCYHLINILAEIEGYEK